MGYSSEDVAKHEAQRCLECGCTEYFTCDLKKYATEYNAEQNKFSGEFNEYRVDFRHPYIEIDNNKCVLCSRCVRSCSEVVGANALGLVNRGYETYVAPSMSDSLSDSTCESCGLCISTCPTGAISENVNFKPGPVKLQKAETICNYCSIGCDISINYKKDFVMKVTGNEGFVNEDGNLCKYPKFGYQYLNDISRITKPLLKVNGRFEEISFKKANNIIADKIKSVDPDDNVFFTGARLSNEEMYLVQKLARNGAKTNNVTSFHYLNRGTGYINNSMANVPFEQLNGASKIYLIGSEINNDNAVAGFMINNARQKQNIPIEFISTNENSSMKHKVDEVVLIKSYYHFIKAVNYYLIANHFENALFIKDNCSGFEDYKKVVLKENFVELVKLSGVKYMDYIIEFAKEFNKQMNAIIVFSEKEVSSNASLELFNLAMITGKLGKTSSGLISLKEKNNSQGLFDMGICPTLGVGSQAILEKSLQKKLRKLWHARSLPKTINVSQYDSLEKGILKNIFIFGEDPMGCAVNKVQVAGWLSIVDYVVVQDYFLTETAQMADLVLPASFPIETGGSYTNTQKVIQKFEKHFTKKLKKTSYKQIIDLLKKLGSKEEYNSIEDVMTEAMSLLPINNKGKNYEFNYSSKDNNNRIFNHGCDYVNKRFDEEFEQAF